MPNLVTAPAGSGLTADQLATAEALVAAQLGVASLELETDVGESGEIGSSGLIALTRPCTAIQSLTVAGAPAMGVLKSVWTLDVSGVVSTMGSGMWGSVYARLPYTIVYTAGWTADTLPNGIRQAVLSVATLGAAVKVGIKSEAMGPVSRSYVDSGSSFTPDVLAFLRPFMPLRY
ncbi:hypothetical protein ACFFLM_19155 [Deinococcus oregonensis]|uniref:Phage gp6-like head-tail connector protein n=1 Tax=Deinococcus oregonensis TaxID=1805970 RepID=A0ABV6B2V2_9DEIO